MLDAEEFLCSEDTVTSTSNAIGYCPHVYQILTLAQNSQLTTQAPPKTKLGIITNI